MLTQLRRRAVRYIRPRPSIKINTLCALNQSSRSTAAYHSNMQTLHAHKCSHRRAVGVVHHSCTQTESSGQQLLSRATQTGSLQNTRMRLCCRCRWHAAEQQGCNKQPAQDKGCQYVQYRHKLYTSVKCTAPAHPDGAHATTSCHSDNALCNKRDTHRGSHSPTTFSNRCFVGAKPQVRAR
jgi:hypothetical protein